MPIMKLTKRAIAGLTAPHPSGKQVLVWDADLKGFGVLLSGKTDAKTYIVQRKLAGGLTRRVTIGSTNALDLDRARADARAVIGEIYRGKDPKAERRAAARRGKTLGTALDDYLSSRKDLSPRSAAGYRGAVEAHLSDWLDLPLRDVTGDLVEARHVEIANEVKKRAGEGARSGGGLVTGAATANAVMRTFRLILQPRCRARPGAAGEPGQAATALLVQGRAARAAGPG